jgi:predicted Zn-dependent protease
MHLSVLPLLRVLVASAAIYCTSAASVVAQSAVAQSPVAQDPGSAQQMRVQRVVDDLAARLAIAEAVRVSIVPTNRLVMSVEPAEHFFELKVEDGFIDTLDDAELTAAIAHELGHVWIFTHHPFLQTEQMANEVAMRLVKPNVLARLYDKVWKRAGVKGDLARFLGPEVSRGLASPEASPEAEPEASPEAEPGPTP